MSATTRREMQEELVSACRSAGLNLLRIGEWNMCKNVEWMVCALSGKLCPGCTGSLSGGGEIVFSLAPKSLDVAPFYSGRYPRCCGNYAENDIYYLEVCVLSAVCRNRDELWRAEVGTVFRCHFDETAYAAMQGKLMRWG